MGELVLGVILAALLGWSWGTPLGEADYVGRGQSQESQGQEGRSQESRNQESRSQESRNQESRNQETGDREERVSGAASWARSVFSAYIVGGLDFMDDGSYDSYVEVEADRGKYGEKPAPSWEDGRFPRIYLGFMGLDLTDYIRGSGKERESYCHKAFCSDEFYMEYPCDWYVGSTDSCPLTFVQEREEEASGEYIQDWAEYFDENLEGSVGEVQAYVEGGGIDGYLEEAMGKPVTDEYQYVLREEDSDWLLIYDLKKGETEAAEIIIWCNLGKVSVRNWDVGLNVNPEEDYGRILVFQEWKAFDFSSEKAINEYMETADFLYELLGTALEQNVEDKIISIERGLFTTPYHRFVSAEIGIWDKDEPERLFRQAFVYIPVTESYQSNWVVVFEWFPGSRQPEGVSNSRVRERIMSTFVALPCYHQVKKGENLSMIARNYGEDPDLAYEIAAFKANHIPQPDLIYPGQEIAIPLGVLFRKVHH